MQIKKKKKITLFDTVNVVCMCILLFVICYPLYYTVIASVSEGKAVASGKVFLWPVNFNLDAYKNALDYKYIWYGYANAIINTVLGVLLNLALTIPAAYALSKKKLPLKSQVTTLFLITMYFGGGLVPTYMLMKNMGLINTRMALIISGGVSVYNIIVTRVFYRSSIPEGLYEAAEIDGASEIKKFFSIALPLSKPIIAVMTLYYAIGRWNDFFTALIYISNRKLEPLQLVLRRVLVQNEQVTSEEFLRQQMQTDLIAAAERAYRAYTMKFAMVFIAAAPLLVAYPFVQKHFVKGVMIGALKE